MTIARGEQMLAADINNLTFFPKGTILTFSSDAWKATSTEFKNIWKICNGQNGTPNLVDKFLRGGENSNFTTPGGADNQDITLTEDHLPSHSHTLSTDGNHTHSVTMRIGHNTYNWGTWGAAATGDSSPAKALDWGAPFKVSTTGAHSHTVDNSGSGAAFTVNTVPSYYTVIYIMKVV